MKLLSGTGSRYNIGAVCAGCTGDAGKPPLLVHRCGLFLPGKTAVLCAVIEQCTENQ